MNFPVPWRCLLPSEAVDFILYDDSAVLRDLSDQTGAMIDVSGERDTPPRLSDRIVTISGLADQKEDACRGIVDKLRRLQDMQSPEEIGYFVIIVPAAAVAVIVGASGATIKEILDNSGVELSIGKENVMGMPDTPIGFEGTADQTVAAVASIHKVVQEMADRGRLQPSDFKYRPDRAAAALASGAGLGLPQVSLPPAQHDPLSGLDPTQNYRTKARIVVTPAVAGWIIGKQGRTIREMQMNCGAFLHLLRDEEVLEGAPPLGADRIVEICGRYERKLEGIQLVLRYADNMPGTQAPKETMMLVPRIVALAAAVSEVGDMCNCSIEVKEFPGHGDVLLTIAGSISSRIQAAQAFMTRIDQAHMEGVCVARAPDGEVVGKDGRPRKELREDGSFEASSTTSHQLGQFGGELPVLRSVRERSVEPPPPATSRSMERTPFQAPAEISRSETSASAGRVGNDAAVHDRSNHRLQDPIHHDSQTASSTGIGVAAAHNLPEVQQRPEHRHQHPPEQYPPVENFAVGPNASQQDPFYFEEPETAGSRSQACSEPPPCPEPERLADTFEHHIAEQTSHANASEAVHLQTKLDLSCSESLQFAAEAQALLARNSMCAFARSQLPILLPEAALQQALVPSGFLAEVAQRCQVFIDLGGKECPGNQQVLLTGTVAGNAAAVFCLQEGLARFYGVCR